MTWTLQFKQPARLLSPTTKPLSFRSADIDAAHKRMHKLPAKYLPISTDIGKHEPFAYADVQWASLPAPEPAAECEVLPPLSPHQNTAEITRKISWLCSVPEGHADLARYFPNLAPLRNAHEVPPLFEFQHTAIPSLFRTFIVQKNNGLLIGATGSGKTYVYGHMIDVLRLHAPERFGNGKVILCVTKPSIVIQTQRVLQGLFRHRDVWVTSYEQLRSTLGEIFIDWVDKVLENGDVVKWPVFTDAAKQLFGMVIFDECQSLKNEGSIQTRIALSLANTDIPVLMGSATPYSRPIHTRATVALVKPYYTHGGSVRVTNRSYPSWLSEMCGTKDPAEWSPSSMRRIQESIEPFTTRIGKVRYKHKTIIKQVLVALTPEKALIYEEAFEEYQKNLINFGRDPLVGFAAVLVAQLKFRQKSELLRADDMATLAVELEAKGKNVIIACAFNDTLRVIHARLLKHHGYKESDISIIMGGQGASDRQKNIDAFQTEKSHIMLLMFQAGGAGLSLHQFEGANVRPRHAVLPPVWNAEEMVQVLGRAHRCNSDSTTHQWVVWYKDTIEEQVAAKLKRKLASMKEVVRTRETWVDLYATEATHGGVVLKHDVTDVKVTDPTAKQDKDSDEEETTEADFDIEQEED